MYVACFKFCLRQLRKNIGYPVTQSSKHLCRFAFRKIQRAFHLSKERRLFFQHLLNQFHIRNDLFGESVLHIFDGRPGAHLTAEQIQIILFSFLHMCKSLAGTTGTSLGEKPLDQLLVSRDYCIQKDFFVSGI